MCHNILSHALRAQSLFLSPCLTLLVNRSGTVAEVITTAVEKLRMGGTILPYSNLRVTGLFSESGRPLSAGYRLHSHGQVPFVKDGGTLVLKVLQ